MDALESLAAEHRLIRRTVDAFEQYVGYVEARVPTERAELRKFMSFFEDFVALHHHDTEETLLFPALDAAGVDWNGEPLARLRREHDQEHYLMRSLANAAQQLEEWSEPERLHFLSIAKTFVAFQRSHMRFESAEVYTLAEKVLSELARARLAKDAERYDDAARGKNTRLTEIADALIRRFLLNECSPCEGTDRVSRNAAGPR